MKRYSDLFAPERRIGEVVESCRGNYSWHVKQHKTPEWKKPGPVYSVDPKTGERKLVS